MSWFAGRAIRWLALLLVLFAVPAGGALALFRTSVGLDMVGRIVARMVSAPGYRIEISGLAGNYSVRYQRETDNGRRCGRRLAGPGGRASRRRARRAVRRSPAYPGADRGEARCVPRARHPPGSRAGPWSERLRIPSLPVATTIDRFAIDRIALAEPVLGETVAGDAFRRGRSARRRGRNRAASSAYRRRRRGVRSVGSAKRGRAGSAAAPCRARSERGSARAAARSRRPAAAVPLDRRRWPGIGLARKVRSVGGTARERNRRYRARARARRARCR